MTSAEPTVGAAPVAAAAPLDIESVTVRFGGLHALADVTLRVPDGGIIGLIGPNGAGKTTLFNAATGLVTPSRGRVRMFGRDVTSWPPHQRARLGVARTFQKIELFGSLSVRENCVVAAESRFGRGGTMSDLLALPASIETRESAVARADEVLAQLGIESFADTRAGEVPAGIARLVELARALCTSPRLLLLDEPSSGLRAAETRHLASFLKELSGQGVSLLVVEHDMKFVLGLCEDVYVLEFGQLLAHGSPSEIRSNPAVQAAYLGQE